jgi:hypothetical protein
MANPSDSQIVRGPRRTIAYATDRQGRMPAKDFMNEDPGADGPSNVEKAGLLHRFTLMANQGVIHNKEHFRKERGEIYSFKKGDIRLPAFRIGNVWYLTHGFNKKKGKWTKAELDRADRIREEHIARQGGIT